MKDRMNSQYASYHRVLSTDGEQSKEIQAAEIENFLRTRPDIRLTHSYIDEGVPGTVSMAERSDGGRLLLDAQAGAFTVVQVASPDRLSRDIDEFTQVRSLLEGFDIDLFFFSDSSHQAGS